MENTFVYRRVANMIITSTCSATHTAVTRYETRFLDPVLSNS